MLANANIFHLLTLGKECKPGNNAEFGVRVGSVRVLGYQLDVIGNARGFVFFWNIDLN